MTANANAEADCEAWRDEFLVPSLLGPAPCDNCPMAQTCKAGLACIAFRRYTGLEPWGEAPREPTSEIYLAIFHQLDGPAARKTSAIGRKPARGASRAGSPSATL